MSGDLDCVSACKQQNKSCRNTKCRHWIKYKEDFNCTLIAIDKHGKMSLREVADRIGVSFVRIKQIQDKAVKKLLKSVDISTLED